MRINLDAIEANLHALCKSSGASLDQVIAVVKKSAYGFGSLKVGHFLSDLGVNFFAVASMEEAKVLRHGGISGNILILENLPIDYYRDARNLNLIHPIVDITQVNGLIEAVKEAPLRLHLCIDTGMKRNGLIPEEVQSDKLLPKLKKLGPYIEGIYTHFHSSDDKDQTLTLIQKELFNKTISFLATEGITGTIHADNSGGALSYKLEKTHKIRTGIALYGCSPDSVNTDNRLSEAATIYAEVTSLRPIKKGQGAGYGHSWHAPEDAQIATVAIGYANGLPRTLSNKGFRVLINGKTYEQIGRVTMDYCLIHIPNNEDVRVGDTVTFCDAFFGYEQSVDALAVAANTIGYEVLCRFGQGLRREYIRNETIVSSDERSIF